MRPLPGDRPSIGGGKPGLGRPDIKPLPGDRPVIGGGKPDLRPPPGIPGRPIIRGKPGLRPPPGIPDRPIIGGSRPGFGKDHPKVGGGHGGNWIGNDFNFYNFNRPNWGYWGGGDRHDHWGDHWYDHHIHNYHNDWYHGCWSGHWGSYWYVPVGIGVTYWGLSALTP